MKASSRPKVLRRRTLTMVERMTYVPVSRLTLNVTLNVLVSQQWLLTGLRPAADYLISRTAPVAPGVRVEQVSAPVRGESGLRQRERTTRRGVVLVLHGSGYLICSSRTHRGSASHLSEYSACQPSQWITGSRRNILFPAAEDDAFAAYRWLLAQGHDPAKIVVAGDSAGGHLAVALARATAQRRATATGSARTIRPADRSVIPGLYRRPAGAQSAAGSAHGQTCRRVIRRGSR